MSNCPPPPLPLPPPPPPMPVPRAYLKFPFVKWPEHVLWYELMKALLQRKELRLNASHEPPIDVQPTTPAYSLQLQPTTPAYTSLYLPHVFLLVLLCHRDVLVLTSRIPSCSPLSPGCPCTYLTYSFLFSSVTGMSLYLPHVFLLVLLCHRDVLVLTSRIPSCSPLSPGCPCTHFTYSFLFSSVTGMSLYLPHVFLLVLLCHRDVLVLTSRIPSCSPLSPGCPCTYLTYSFLFSSVTGMSLYLPHVFLLVLLCHRDVLVLTSRIPSCSPLSPGCPCTYLTYSFLFSSVTGMSLYLPHVFLLVLLCHRDVLVLTSRIPSCSPLSPGCPCTHFTYSFLFSSVTGMSLYLPHVFLLVLLCHRDVLVLTSRIPSCSPLSPGCPCTYLTYSFLFSSVTGMSLYLPHVFLLVLLCHRDVLVLTSRIPSCSRLSPGCPCTYFTYSFLFSSVTGMSLYLPHVFLLVLLCHRDVLVLTSRIPS